MSRHRDVRCMNYSEEYEGYDDVYGHSVEDDYCVSPSAEQFLFDRSKQQNIASFITEPDIIEDNEDNEELPISFNDENVTLTDIELGKLMSCMEPIKNVIGDTVPDSEIKKKIIQSNFDVKIALDLILKESSPKTATGSSMANKDNLEPYPDAASVKPQSNSFIIPKLSFNKQENIEGKKLSSKYTFQATTPSNVKIIPAGKRSVVKGFNISGTENTDLLNSRTESPRSQSPYSDYNSPEVKRKENIVSKEKRAAFSNANSPRCQSPVSGHQTPDLDPKIKFNEEKDVAKIYKDKRGDSKEQLHLIVVGHVDAGKSTLLGRLLCELGEVPTRLIHKYQQESKKIGKQSFAYAWVLDETGEERERGITMDVGHSKFETETKCITLLDAPGHKDFIPNMIIGATQADVALLVVDATRGEFETGFDSGGQTREHALLLRSLGISQLTVVINKLDTVDWSKERFDEIVSKMSVFLKQAGFKDNVTFVPCSGLSGENILTKPKEPLSNWYTGPTLVNVINNFKCPERHIDKPFRFSVNDIFKGTGSGFCVSGHVETGMVALGDKVLVLPRNETAVIKGLQIDEVSITNAFAGDQVSLILSGIDQQNVGIGDIICNPQNPVPVTTRFQAHVVVFAVKIPIMKGLPVIIHQQSLVQPAVITKLVAQLHRSTGEMIKKKPRCLPKNSSAIIEITTQNSVCMELYKDIKQLGRIMLRVEGTTIAAGLITKIK
ncbi:HBS1-like protein isoform X1 [Bombus vosnesenskii]|uniref:HBS1-like protein isoform X1 n=2 Tax=Pyrobombus TaxID=144703 RepID=A0A6J3LKG6_9HYME|nr:HBS1-like protein isoform X1 [Bombus vancouverensis nearcticus]XP_033309180.1 HBS1-like protein isoform X1 [Bombus bifarius]XP_033364389.1 HBS1-like protein isoform X1 [Bombus vosnesenskii]